MSSNLKTYKSEKQTMKDIMNMNNNNIVHSVNEKQIPQKTKMSKLLDHSQKNKHNKINNYTDKNDSILISSQRTDMADIINPIKCKRDQLKQIGLKPKNHINDQFKFVKSTKVKYDERHIVKKEKERFIMNKFKNIDSKIACIYKCNEEKDCYKTDTEQELNDKNTKSKKVNNFKMINVENVINDSKELIQSKIRCEKLAKYEKENQPPNSAKIKSFGKTPNYLKNKKDQENKKQKEESYKNALEKQCPVGYYMLDDENKNMELIKFKDNYNILQDKLRTSPLQFNNDKSRKIHQDQTKEMDWLQAKIDQQSEDVVFLPKC